MRQVAYVLMGLFAALLSIVGLRRKLEKGAPMADTKKIVRQVFEEPWKGNWEVIDKYVAPGYVGHDPAEPEPIHGPAGARANFQKYLDAFTGAQITVDDQIAEGDKVATRWTGRGTHTGELSGIAPTGKEVTITGLTISLLEDGLIVEEWTTWDTLGMLVQLGAVPIPATA
jgi:predicted ester cyclase